MILLFFLLCSVAYGQTVHSDCYNHGSKDGTCICNPGYTGFNCELCERCNYRGTCHGNFKVEGEETDNDGTKECVCDTKPNGQFIWGGDFCNVPAVCQHNNVCKQGICVNNLCNCNTTAGGSWSGDTCNIEPTCPDGCVYGTCTMELGTTADTFGLIRAVSTGKNCICDDGYGGAACDKVLVSVCNDKGYLEGGTCVCEEGYGDDCSCDHECAWDNALSQTCPTGLCQCKDGFEQPDCTCKGDQCSGHGTCSESGCDCEEGWMNYQCSGHGECNGDECTCHPRFKGEMCNVLKPMPTCEQGQHYMENGTYYEEEGACDVVENRNTFFGREYNTHPLQSIQYEATSWTDCHQKCMEGAERNVIDESRDISPIKFEDRYGWGGENPSWVKKVWGHYAGVEEYYNQGWFLGEQYFYEELDAPVNWYETNTNIDRTVYKVDSGSYLGTRCTFSTGSGYTRVWEETDYPNGTWNTNNEGVEWNDGKPANAYYVDGVYFMKTNGICTTQYGSVIETSVYMDPEKKAPNTHQKVYKMQPICLPGIAGVYPAIPKYYKRMDSFETKYPNPTHYAYDNGKCTCFGLDQCSGTKTITYNPKMSEWDTHQAVTSKSVTAPVQQKPGIISYWKRDGEYCIPCPSGYHNVSGTHCCPNGWEGGDCEINIDDCKDDPCDANVHDCIDDAYASEYGLVLNVSEYACVCKPGKTGTFNIGTGLETCDKECCIRGESVTHGNFNDSLTVHGTCKSGEGGCDCDYGYEGPNCECTDKMCEHGYCNVGGDTFCKCHPGYELDDSGKCTAGAKLCADNPCVNGNCTNTENDYHCKCEVGYIGKNCSVDTNWNIGNTTCDGYLLNGRCVDCPHGTYSRGPTDTKCRIILTDENIQDAVDSALNDTNGLYGDISTFDTSAVTNMDRLFKDKTVPDISVWDVSSVTSMREMFMGTTKPDISLWTFHPDVDKFWWERNNVIYSQITCAKVVNGRCQFTNSGLSNTVLAWENDEAGTEYVYGPLATWDVSYVTNMTDLFQDSTKNPDITNWDMSNVVHADKMLSKSGFTQRIDNKDLSSLQTADNMMPTDYGGHLCGKHFLRVCEARGYKVDTDALKDFDCANRRGFENMGSCLTSTVDGDSNVIKQAVEDYYGTAAKQAAIITKHGEMSEWDVSQVQSMHSLFKDNKNGIPPLAKWDTSSVTDMTSMFENSDFNEDISHWDVRKVDKFNKMFKGNMDFAVDLTFWEIHASEHVETFSGNTHYDGLMFKIDTILPEPLTDATFKPAVNDWFDADKKDEIIADYGEISDWLVYEVTNMSNAFEGKTFNEDISEWNVGAVTDMSSMFERSTFNSPIGKWNVDKVRDMSSMFKGSSFNQLIDRWNVSSVEDMSSMFENSVFSRPIGDWDLWGTGWDIVQKPGDGNSKCFAEEGMIITLDPDTRQNLQSNYRLCFDECTGTYPIRLDDIEGRTRSRGGGEVGSHYTPYMAGFAFVENTSLAYTCQCATEIEDCDSSPFDRVLEYRDMNTDNMFTGNDKFIQPLCGIGWRYRNISSLNLPQRGVSLTCDICNTGEHMSTCGLCLGEFRFDHCLDSPMAFTLKELHDFGGSHGMTGLVVDAGGIPLDVYASLDDINNGYVNPYACNCEYEEGMKGCLVVNGRKQVRMKEWYADGLTDFSTKTITQYYCELDFLDGRDVASAEGFNSVECTEDTLLNQIECGLVGGNWNGKCDKCLKPCDPPELGVKYISKNRECEKCDEGMTVWNNECVLCPDGKFTDENHAWCGKCPSGTYGANGECLTCAQGAASTFEGALQCSTCPAGTFSVGTGCQDCPTGKSSLNGAWFCYDVAHCRHGETTKIAKAGNWCDLCNDGFKRVDGTCVADCVHGKFTVLNGKGTCHCTDMWGQTLGSPCNACDYCDPKYVHIGETCHDTPCDDTLFTDCVCGVSPVIDGDLCFKNEPYGKCSGDQTDCLCNTGDGYERVVAGSRCIDSQVVALCGNNAISTKDCSDLKIGGNCLEKCAHDGQIVHSATHVVLNGKILPLCGGEKKTECYGVPWKVMDYNCGTHVECEVNYIVNTSQTYRGMGNENASTCCAEKQQCKDFTCPSTSAERAGDYVLVRTEQGMCNGDVWYSISYINDQPAVFYNTIEEALAVCGLYTGESIIAHIEGKGYVCEQRWGDDYDIYVTSLKHQEGCDTWYSSLRVDSVTDHSATTYTYQRSKPQDTYSDGLVFGDEGVETCCTEVCDGKHSGYLCTHPIYGICGDECTAAHFATDGDEPSTCCEADSWYCDSGACDVGFTKNSEYCGEKCNETHFGTTYNMQNVSVELSGIEIECEKTMKEATTTETCAAACEGDFTHFQMDGDKCYCMNTDAPCKSDTRSDCLDWCPGGLVQKDLVSDSRWSYYNQTVCENVMPSNVCPPGWKSYHFYDCYFVSSDTHVHTDYESCFDNKDCCARVTATYERVEIPVRDKSFCCNIDDTQFTCLTKQCPPRHEYNSTYYTDNHTSECCDKIPDIYYCDTHNSGSDFVCPNNKRLYYDDVFCDGNCSETQCCKPENEFCDYVPCEGADVPTGLDYCDGECDAAKCCKPPPKCDRSHNCASGEIDWNYICTVTENGVCASSEYELGKCCTTDLSPYCYADDRYDQSESVNVTRVSWDTPTHMGNPMPGCNEKEGYISYYDKYGRTGGSFSDESFEGVCCKYVETCPSAHACASDTHPKGGYSDSVPRHCASGSSSGWDRIQNCTDNSMCCEQETCATAQERLGTQCYSTDWDVWDTVQQDRLTRSQFFDKCCKPTCGQLQYETEEGDRGYDLCHNPGGSGSLKSWDNTEGNLTDKTWVVNNCCDNSCGKQALKGYACPSGSSKNSDYWSVISSDYTQTTFESNCCHMSCDSVNGTSHTCGSGKVENIKTWDYESKSVDSEWYSARSSIDDFQSTCCIDATCNNIVNQQNFRHQTCEDVYGLTYSSSYGSIDLTDPSDPLPCCSGVADACRPEMSLGSRCPTGSNYVSWVSSSVTVTSENFQDSCCTWKCSDVGVDCGVLFPSHSWTSGQVMSDLINKESVCCDSEWKCDIYPQYKGWDSYYTRRDISGTEYEAAYVDVFPSTWYSENTYKLWSRFIKYDVHVTESEWIEKCMCPSNELGCLKDEMIDQGLITTCGAKATELNLKCVEICEKSTTNTGCDGFSNITEFDTKLFGGQLAEGPDLRYFNNRFMERCCVRSDGVGWVWDWSLTN